MADSKRERSLFFLGVALVTLGYLTFSLFSIFFLNTWFDEANHVYKAWLSAEGLANIFTDFREKYGPIGFYTQVFLQGVFGPDILPARFLSFAFLTGALLFLFDTVRRLAGRWWALLSVAFIALHPGFIAYFVSATPYALIAFFVCTGLWFFSVFSPPRALVFASLLFTSAFLVRYNMLPALCILWAAYVVIFRGWRETSIAIFSSLTLILISLYPFFRLDALYALAALLEMFGPLASFVPVPVYPSFHDPGYFWGNRIDSISSVLAAQFHLWAILLAGFIVFVVGKPRFSHTLMWAREHFALVVSSLVAAGLFASHFLFPGHQPYDLYALYYVPFLVLASTLTAAALFRREALLQKAHAFPIAVLFGVFALFTPVSVGFSGQLQHFANPLRSDDTDLNRVERAGEVVAAVTRAEDVILTTDDPYHVLYAGRYEIPPLINKFFTYRSNIDESTLERFRLYNAGMFLDWTDSKATVILMQRDTDRLDAILSPNEQERFKELLANEFSLIQSVPRAYPRAYVRGEGILDIYRRNE